METKVFPGTHRLRPNCCGDWLIPGRFGHIAEHDAGRFAPVLAGSLENVLRWRPQRALGAGIRGQALGDSEGDPAVRTRRLEAGETRDHAGRRAH